LALAAFGQHRKLSAETTDLLRRVALLGQFKDEVESTIANQAEPSGQGIRAMRRSASLRLPIRQPIQDLEISRAIYLLSQSPRYRATSSRQQSLN
jgi:hypothetical protein